MSREDKSSFRVGWIRENTGKYQERSVLGCHRPVYGAYLNFNRPCVEYARYIHMETRKLSVASGRYKIYTLLLSLYLFPSVSIFSAPYHALDRKPTFRKRLWPLEGTPTCRFVRKCVKDLCIMCPAHSCNRHVGPSYGTNAVPKHPQQPNQFNILDIGRATRSTGALLPSESIARRYSIWRTRMPSTRVGKSRWQPKDQSEPALAPVLAASAYQEQLLSAGNARNSC